MARNVFQKTAINSSLGKEGRQILSCIEHSRFHSIHWNTEDRSHRFGRLLLVIGEVPPILDGATSCSHRAEGAEWLLPEKAAVAADILRRLSVTQTCRKQTRLSKIRLVRPRDGAVLCDVGCTQVLGTDIFGDYAAQAAPVSHGR